MTLKVTPEQVRTKAQEIEAQKNMMADLMTAMQQEVNRLPAEFWQSQSGVQFSERYQTVQRNCQGALDTLITHIRNLREAAQKYDAVEQAQVQKVGQLNTTNIFN